MSNEQHKKLAEQSENRSGRRNRLERLGDLLPGGPSTPMTPPTTLASPGECWCGGAGFRWRDLGEYENDWARRIVDSVVYCVCDVGEQMLQQQRVQFVEDRRAFIQAVRNSRWHVESGIPARFQECRLERPLSGRYIAPLLADEKPESWFFWGLPGRGKTGLAVGYARRWAFPDDPDELPRRVLFRPLPDLLGELRASYDRQNGPREADLLAYYRQASLLILDDLGAEQVSGSGWVEDRLYQVVGQRHGDMAPTFFTGNLSPDELVGRLGERITARMLELCGEARVVHVEGPNLRRQH